MHAHVAPPARTAFVLLVRRCVVAGALAASCAGDVLAIARARGAPVARNFVLDDRPKESRAPDGSPAPAEARPPSSSPTPAWPRPVSTGTCAARTNRLPTPYDPDAPTRGPTVYGGAPHLEPSRIRAVFAAHRDELLACRVAGSIQRVDAAWTICNDGSVVGVATAGSDEATSACVARALARWWFPRIRHTGAVVGVRYPLDLDDGARADLLVRDARGADDPGW